MRVLLISLGFAFSANAFAHTPVGQHCSATEACPPGIVCRALDATNTVGICFDPTVMDDDIFTNNGGGGEIIFTGGA